MSRKLAKKFLSFLGYKLSKLPGRLGTAPPLFKTFGIDTVFDVGANIGQYARSLRQDGYDGRIISFEAVPEVHDILRENAVLDENWFVGENVALSDSEGTAVFYRSFNSVSSSLLIPTSESTQACDQSGICEKLSVPTTCFDRLFESHTTSENKVMLKIDVQGAEMKVLVGSLKSLSRITLIQLEMNIPGVYEGQATYFEVDQFLRQHCFTLVDVLPGFRNQVNGRLLQYDAVYAQL